MKTIFISDKITHVCPNFKVAAISCKVTNTPYDEALWQTIERELNSLKELPVSEANKLPAIQANRKVYKLLGKDPNRYRPSAEALRRRIAKGDGLYKISTLVDLVNLVSLKSGYSIGGFDEEKIDGSELTLGVGEAEEVFHAIGRGLLNIEGLPVYRDNTGGIGTPTSDDERTAIDIQTKHLLMLINAYDGGEKLQEAVDFTVELLNKHAFPANIIIKYVEAKDGL